MSRIECNGKTLENLDRFNVLLGKNGCGKSTVLKEADANLRGREGVGVVRYVSPERHGFLTYEPGVDQNMESDANWLPQVRRTNQAQGFKQQSAALYRRLELEFLRKLQKEHIENDYVPRNFDSEIEKINSLLDRVEIRSAESSFHIFRKADGSRAQATDISSGESELIALAIEILSFANTIPNGLESYLLLDEPDVHLHPDLQHRLVEFLREILGDTPVVVVIATHSTAFVGALGDAIDARVAFMVAGDTEITFEGIDEVTKDVLPMFGAHPLSNIFNKRPILIVEGEDDRRIWDQASRSSEGRVNVFPCVSTSKDVMNEYEVKAAKIINSVYDGATGFSLRDRDDSPEEIDDIPPVVRMRLSCRTAENLILSDEALAIAGTTWDDFYALIQRNVDESENHPRLEESKTFLSDGANRKSAPIKQIRNALVGYLTNKPWEVLVGQAIAAATQNNGAGEGSIRSFLGVKTSQNLLG